MEKLTPEHMCNHYYVPIYRRILAMVGNRELAEDLTQDTFMKALRAFASYNHSGQIFAWLCSIALNTVRDTRRRATLIDFLSLQDISNNGGYDPVDGSNPDPLDRYEHEDVRQALELLPTGYRTVLHLCACEDYRQREVADMLGLSVGAVKMRFNRARTMFKHAYGVK